MVSNKYILYTDGSCIQNPGGNGGWACVIITPQQYPIKISGFSPSTTNQRMELTAVIQGLGAIPDGSIVDVYSDSAYVCNAVNQKWLSKWKRIGWVNSKKEPVANIDLWKQFDMLLLNREVALHWVKGHADNPINNECDKLAKEIINFTNEILNVDIH